MGGVGVRRCVWVGVRVCCWNVHEEESVGCRGKGVRVWKGGEGRV